MFSENLRKISWICVKFRFAMKVPNFSCRWLDFISSPNSFSAIWSRPKSFIFEKLSPVSDRFSGSVHFLVQVRFAILRAQILPRFQRQLDQLGPFRSHFGLVRQYGRCEHQPKSIAGLTFLSHFPFECVSALRMFLGRCLAKDSFCILARLSVENSILAWFWR